MASQRKREREEEEALKNTIKPERGSIEKHYQTTSCIALGITLCRDECGLLIIITNQSSSSNHKMSYVTRKHVVERKWSESILDSSSSIRFASLSFSHYHFRALDPLSVFYQIKHFHLFIVSLLMYGSTIRSLPLERSLGDVAGSAFRIFRRTL